MYEKLYVHEIATVDLSKIYFLKNVKKTCKSNKLDLNCDWIIILITLTIVVIAIIIIAMIIIIQNQNISVGFRKIQIKSSWTKRCYQEKKFS